MRNINETLKIGGTKMKKFLLTLGLTVCLAIISGSAMATVFTFNQAQLVKFYETNENPSSTGTNLQGNNPFGGGGAKFTGDLLQGGSGPADIFLGVRSSGIDFDGITGLDTPTTLGVNDLTGFTSYSLFIENTDELTSIWNFFLYASSTSGVAKTIQTTPFPIAFGATKAISLDLTGFSAPQLANITDIGDKDLFNNEAVSKKKKFFVYRQGDMAMTDSTADELRRKKLEAAYKRIYSKMPEKDIRDLMIMLFTRH